MEEKNIVIKIKATGLSLTSAIEEYAREKIDSLRKFSTYHAREGNLLFEVELGKVTAHHHKGDIFRAEINVTAEGLHLRSEAEKENLFMAIDEAKEEMSRELRKHKSKRADFLRRGGAAFKKIFNGKS